MAAVSFADVYKASQFSLEPANMTLREKSLKAFVGDYSDDDCIGAAKVHLGIKDQAFLDRLVELVRKDDPSFSIVTDEREARVIATGFLAAMIERGDVEACLCLLCGSVAGKRTGEFQPELREIARRRLIELAVNERTTDKIKAGKGFSAKGVLAAVEAWKPTQDVEKLGAALKATTSDLEAVSTAEMKVLGQVNDALHAQLTFAREEIELLWWHVGGYSTTVEKPYADFPPLAVPVLAGLELAKLVRTRLGPASIAALLQLRLRSVGDLKPVTLHSALAATKAAVPLQIGKLEKLEALCPILTSLAAQSDDGSKSLLKQNYGVGATATFERIDIAMQAFREWTLLRLIQADA